MQKQIVLLAMICFPFQSFGWGAVGHRVTGLIAQEELTSAAKAGLKDLLGAESLSDVANWADSLRSTGEYRQSMPYHYEKVPDSYTYLQNLKEMPDKDKRKGGAVSAIVAAMDVVRDPKAAKTLKRDALRFLVHFLGDLHQPLHTGRPEDNGGNKVQLIWFDYPASLHSVWDRLMVFTGHPDVVNFEMTQQEAAAAYAKYLMATHDKKKVTLAIDVDGWMNESMAVRTTVYDPTYETDQKEYQRKHLPELDRRVFEAGHRLAYTLNSIYSGEPAQSKEMELRNGIEAIVGPIHALISFLPRGFAP